MGDYLQLKHSLWNTVIIDIKQRIRVHFILFTGKCTWLLGVWKKNHKTSLSQVLLFLLYARVKLLTWRTERFSFIYTFLLKAAGDTYCYLIKKKKKTQTGRETKFQEKVLLWMCLQGIIHIFTLWKWALSVAKSSSVEQRKSRKALRKKLELREK